MNHMDNMHDGFWNSILPDVREAFGLRPLSIEESEQAYRDAQAVELSDDEIDGLMAKSMSDIPKEPGFSPSPDDATVDVPDATREEFLQLNREKGEEDPEVDDLIQRQRDEALGDDEDGDEDEPKKA